MKTLWLTVTPVFLTVAAALAQTSTPIPNQNALPAPTPYQVVYRDANSAVWERTVYEAGPSAQAVPRTHRYTELASGLNFRDPQTGEWTPSKEEIYLLPDGTAAATNAQHQAFFPSDLAQGVIGLVTDGIQLQSRPICLSYDDGSNSVIIAILTNSVGELVSPNQVIYPNAFEGASASMRYTYTKGGFEQDVLVQGQLPSPESYGLNPATTRLQVLTEFFDADDPVEAPGNSQDGLSDTTLIFGAMKMIQGRAFSINETNQFNSRVGGTPTYKSWLKLNGRKFLLEEVPYPLVAPQLEQLPTTGSIGRGNTNLAAANSVLNKVSARRLLPPPRIARTGTNKIQVASAAVPNRGLDLDYQMLNGGLTGFTFQGDTTYFITGEVDLSGITTIEGGTVLKYTTNYIGSPLLYVVGPINCRTSEYSPAIFTARDDNTVGEPISGSTGVPSGTYAHWALWYQNSQNTSSSITLQNLVIKYAYAALMMESGTNNLLRNIQFVDDSEALDSSGATSDLQNALMWNMQYACFDAIGNSTFKTENLTVDGAEFLWLDPGGGSLKVTDSLLVSVAQIVMTAGAYNATNSSSTGVFQVVGAGSHYLATNSPYRNVGTTNIDPNLLAALAQETTYPPIVYSNATLSIPMTFSPQAQRDSGDAPDLGYHYAPLDYVFGNTIAQSNLTFTAGTAAAWFYTASGGTYGLDMGDSATASFNGMVTAPCHFCRYSMVQEGNGNWTPQSWLGGITGQSYTHAPPGLTAQFTVFSAPATEAGPYRDDWFLFIFTGNDCEFYGSGGGAYDASINATNCLYVNGGTGLFNNYGSANLTLENCTFFRGNVEADNTSGQPWPVTIVNCAFDSTTFYMNAHGGQTNGYYTDYNSFLVGSNTTLYLGGHEVFVTNSYNWQTSWFGNYYQPTNSPLINKGSTTADQVGLYHFTTQTNQVPETNSIVDIGYHYVATDTNGVPLDANGDGIPDYWEDANGNGLVDSGEIGWNIPGDLGLTVIIARPRNGSTLP